jgi:hypothetical protein
MFSYCHTDQTEYIRGGCSCPFYVCGVSFQGGYEKSAPFVIDEGADLCLKLSRKTDLSKVHIYPKATHTNRESSTDRCIYTFSMLYMLTYMF